MIGCLCIHGFTGGPYEVEPLAAFLKENTDWIVKVVTLPGHGNRLQLRGVDYKDWIKEAEKEVEHLLTTCDEVYVIGFSMGGLIAGHLAAIYPIHRVVFLSAAAYYVNPRQLVMDIRECAKDFFKGQIAENQLYQRYKKKIMETPIHATLQFRRLVRRVKPALESITIPALIVQGERDGIVPIKSAKYIYNTISAEEKEIIFVPNASHLICLCDDRETLFEKVFSFLTKDREEDHK